MIKRVGMDFSERYFCEVCKGWFYEDEKEHKNHISYKEEG